MCAVATLSIWRGYMLTSWSWPGACTRPIVHLRNNIHAYVNALAYVNDDTSVNVWQDVPVTNSSGASAASESRRPASNVDVLKAMADPLRLNMLYVLSRSTKQGPPAMTVKELAAELGEPQTKLYRHVKHLEAAGLIGVASSRVVSGIVEQRYQAARSAVIVRKMSQEERSSPEAEAMVAAIMEMFRREYFAAVRGEQSSAGDSTGQQRTLMAYTDGEVSAARAAAIREQLSALSDELGTPPDPDQTDLVPIKLLLGYLSPDS
jgi:DNA-binding transcriptional ArsR family regulator